LLKTPDKDVDLLRAAPARRRLDNEELDVEAYIGEVARMAKPDRRQGRGGRERPGTSSPALNQFLFKERGFQWQPGGILCAPNSYLNEVIDDREGLPLTLSVLYMELARRLDLPVVGVGLPGHFVVRFEPPRAPSPSFAASFS